MRRKGKGDLTIRLVVTVMLYAALLWMAACGGKSDQQIQQQAQQATERARTEADKAAVQARIAAREAARDAKDVAVGVRAGLRNKKGEPLININSATRADLATLPGVTSATARRIAEHRPYSEPRDLVRRGVVSQSEFDRIADRVITR